MAKHKTTKGESKSKFKGGLTTDRHPGYVKGQNNIWRKITFDEKKKALKRIGIKTPKADTDYHKKKISKLYNQFNEFIGQDLGKIKVIRTRKRETLKLAKDAHFAVYGKNVYVHKAARNETVRTGKYMGERVLIRTEYGKTERIFIGGAEVFERVVEKLRHKKLKPYQMITGSFFGISSFRRSYPNIDQFLHYLTVSFIPHMENGVAKTTANIAKHKSQLIKFLSIVEITNPQFMDDLEDDDENE